MTTEYSEKLVCRQHILDEYVQSSLSQSLVSVVPILSYLISKQILLEIVTNVNSLTSGYFFVCYEPGQKHGLVDSLFVENTLNRFIFIKKHQLLIRKMKSKFLYSSSTKMCRKCKNPPRRLACSNISN